MNWKSEWKTLVGIVAVFLICYFLPVGWARFDNAVSEMFYLVNDYAKMHMLLSLVPAFFIAGAISVFIGQASVIKYFGPQAPKLLSYSIASISGIILAVCSCTILPMFAGIYSMGAGIGPAFTFLYSGPAINVLAIVWTARILGLEIGVARTVSAILFAIIVGLLMAWFFHRKDKQRASLNLVMPSQDNMRPLWQNSLYIASLVGILIFANWSRPGESFGLWNLIYSIKWFITGLLSLGLAVMLVLWFKVKWHGLTLIVIITLILALAVPTQPTLVFVTGMIGLSVVISRDKGEAGEWFAATWGFAKRILPLLLIGIIISGLLLGRPGQEGLIPSIWVANAVGGNSISANFFASVVSGLMYFCTLTEVPIIQGLMGSGMGKGPALASLMAGPALSLPNMLILNSLVGTKKTFIYVLIVIILATIAGLIFGGIS